MVYLIKNLRIVIGFPIFQKIFDKQYYRELKGGILEAFGKLFTENMKLYVYPATELDQGSAQANQLVTSDHINIDENKKILLQFLQKNNHLEDIRDFDINVTAIWSRKVLKMIQEGDLEFEKMVPDVVSKIVKEKKGDGDGG